MTTRTRLLAGGESPPWVDDGTEALDEALPNGRIGTFDGHGHVAMLTAPDRFIDEVLALIRESD